MKKGINELIKTNQFKNNNITMEPVINETEQVLDNFVNDLRTVFNYNTSLSEGEIMDIMSDYYEDLLNLVVHDGPYNEVKNSCIHLTRLCILISEYYRRKE